MSYIFSSPGKYIQGKGEISCLGQYTGVFGKRMLVIIDQFLYDMLHDKLNQNIEAYETEIEYSIFNGECTYDEMKRLQNLYEEKKCDIVVGVGGGKTLDTAKGTANYCDAPLAIVPTSASQDAPCSSLSVVYKADGKFDSFMIHKKNPDLVIVDSQVICEAPARMIAAGMGDGLSTLFESRACIASDLDNTAGGKATNTAEMLAQLCYKIIMRDGVLAYQSVERKVVTKALENVIEANIFLSGIGAEGTGDACAHGIYNALTTIPDCEGDMHGVLVSFGIIVQLVLENESPDVIKEVLDFLTKVNLPVCLKDIGVDNKDADKLMAVAKVAVEDTVSNMPFAVSAEDVYAAMIAADALGMSFTGRN